MSDSCLFLLYTPLHRENVTAQDMNSGLMSSNVLSDGHC